MSEGRKILVVCSEKRTDIYWDGVYHSSHPSGAYAVLPFEEDDNVEFFHSRSGKEIRADESPILVQVDDALILKDHDEELVLPLLPILATSVDRICASIDNLQRQAGFFKMSAKQKAAVTRYLSTCILDLNCSPKVLSIPVYGWYNYAEMDDSAVDESAVLDHLTLQWGSISDEVSGETAVQLGGIHGFMVPEQVFVRSHIILEAVRRINL